VTLQQLEEEWGDEEIVPVKEVAHALAVSERRVWREARRRHIEIPGGLRVSFRGAAHSSPDKEQHKTGHE
jgi:hypothetical protein